MPADGICDSWHSVRHSARGCVRYWRKHCGRERTECLQRSVVINHHRSSNKPVSGEWKSSNFARLWAKESEVHTGMFLQSLRTSESDHYYQALTRLSRRPYVRSIYRSLEARHPNRREAEHWDC